MYFLVSFQKAWRLLLKVLDNNHKMDPKLKTENFLFFGRLKAVFRGKNALKMYFIFALWLLDLVAKIRYVCICRHWISKKCPVIFSHRLELVHSSVYLGTWKIEWFHVHIYIMQLKDIYTLYKQYVDL